MARMLPRSERTQWSLVDLLRDKGFLVDSILLPSLAVCEPSAPKITCRDLTHDLTPSAIGR